MVLLKPVKLSNYNLDDDSAVSSHLTQVYLSLRHRLWRRKKNGIVDHGYNINNDDQGEGDSDNDEDDDVYDDGDDDGDNENNDDDA